eukprot:Sdes_comp15426_c0_seq1m4320
MRFRAKISDANSLFEFTSLVQTVSRISKLCVLRLTPEKIHFIMNGNPNDGTSKIWSELSVATIFHEYKVESAHENNEILLEIGIDNLLRTMKTAVHSQYSVLKLSKKDNYPHLSVEILITSSSGRLRTISQNIPVGVLKHEMNQLFQEPKLPEPDVCVYLPSVKLLKNIIDKMKSQTHILTLSASSSGILGLKFETSNCIVNTTFSNLQAPVWNDSPQNSRIVSTSEITIDSRKFSQFLGGNILSPTNVIASIVSSHALMLFILQDDISLSYYIPAFHV